MHAHAAVRSVPTQFATARRVTDATKKRGVERSVVPLRRANVLVPKASADDAKPPAVDYKSDEFTIPDAPIKDLVPTGAWKVIDGGVCAPKGFKAAAFKAKLRKSAALRFVASIAAGLQYLHEFSPKCIRERARRSRRGATGSAADALSPLAPQIAT